VRAVFDVLDHEHVDPTLTDTVRYSRQVAGEHVEQKIVRD
jgi:hypothetical protein